MCVISSIIFHKMFVTKHNEQNEKLERSETIAKMVTERLEVLVRYKTRRLHRYLQRLLNED